jgi:superfamily II DNA or RNA helicase
VREYQIDAIADMIRRKRSLVVSPTGSGKSLIIYVAIRAYIQSGRKGILVVPTQGLVEQMYNDFKDYSTHNGWNVDGNVQRLYSGFDKNFSKNLLITTWQSLIMMPDEFCEQFDFMFGDECHQWDSKSFTTIGKRFVNTKYRTGFTGTLEDSKPHEMVLEGIFGKIYYAEKTNSLIKQGYLAETHIKCLVLKHHPDICEEYRNKSYQEEIEYLTQNDKRNDFITKLAVSLKGNTLILFNFVEKHGLILHEKIKALAPNRVYLIHGHVDTDIREDIRNIVNKSDNSILLASYGTFSVGQNVPNLHNGIFAHPSKSKIRNLQSLGRGLRKGENKTSFVLYDIADDMRHKGKLNYTLGHFLERVRIYTSEKFDYKVYNLDFGKE